MMGITMMKSSEASPLSSSLRSDTNSGSEQEKMLSVRLLLLSFCSVSLLSPGAGFRKHRLCGVQLVEALLLVCGDKGLFYQPGRRGRDEDVSETMTDGAVSRQVMRKEETAVSGVIKRGIVEQCCHFSCDYYDLENYCNI